MINMSENQIVNVVISGGMGKMGQLVSSFIETKDGFNISGIYDPAQNSEKYHNFDLESLLLLVFFYLAHSLLSIFQRS